MAKEVRLLLSLVFLAGLLLLVLVFLAGLALTEYYPKSEGDRPDTYDNNAILNGAANAAPAPAVLHKTNSPSASEPMVPEISQANEFLLDAMKFMRQQQFDSALDKVNAAIKLDPKNIAAFSIRGQVYTSQKNWELAQKDFESMLHIDPQNTSAEFDLNEVKFEQKDYDDARYGFVGLESDPDLGDLASYKVFLCDLLAGHEARAKGELDAFNQVGSNASFYFANVAWYVVHKKPEKARTWLNSGVHIYAPNKIYLYTFSLKDLGYLPLPD